MHNVSSEVKENKVYRLINKQNLQYQVRAYHFHHIRERNAAALGWVIDKLSVGSGGRTHPEYLEL